MTILRQPINDTKYCAAACACARSAIWLSYQMTTTLASTIITKLVYHGSFTAVFPFFDCTENVVRVHGTDAPICFGNPSFGDPIFFFAQPSSSFFRRCASFPFLLPCRAAALTSVKRAAYTIYNGTPFNGLCSGFFFFFTKLDDIKLHVVIFVSFLLDAIEFDGKIHLNFSHLQQKNNRGEKLGVFVVACSSHLNFRNNNIMRTCAKYVCNYSQASPVI